MNRMPVAVALLCFVGTFSTQAQAQETMIESPPLSGQASSLGSVFAGESYFHDQCLLPCIPACHNSCCHSVEQPIMTPSVVLMPACGGCQQIVYLSQTTPDGNLVPVYSGSNFTTGSMRTWQVVPTSGNFVPQFRTVPPANIYSQPSRMFPSRRGTWFPLRGRRVR
ncbi:MAG: hypothetical protein ACR2NP_01670 [Pirellulaceae bacterium]